MQQHVRFGKIGTIINLLLPVEVWIKKMNRQLIVLAKEFQPDALYFFTTGRILYGTVATIKAILPDVKVVWVWSDTPMNLQAHNIDTAKLVDITATYSSTTVKPFSQLGFNNVVWIPLAGDLVMHGKAIKDTEDYLCDISFVGGWRPERERTMKLISDSFKNLNISIRGPLWREMVKDKSLKGNIKGGGIYASALAEFFNRSRININQIDDTNYPAANMRFFEICTAGGLQLSSSCPEMEKEFVHKKHLLYYRDEKELIQNIDWIINNPLESSGIRSAGQDLVYRSHSYTNRVSEINEYLFK
jgi:spore maturation protein CgeB